MKKLLFSIFMLFSILRTQSQPPTSAHIDGPSSVCPGHFSYYSAINLNCPSKPACNQQCAGGSSLVRQPYVEFDWNVIGGTIVAGQGSQTIKVVWDECPTTKGGVGVKYQCHWFNEIQVVQNGINCRQCQEQVEEWSSGAVREVKILCVDKVSGPQYIIKSCCGAQANVDYEFMYTSAVEDVDYEIVNENMSIVNVQNLTSIPPIYQRLTIQSTGVTTGNGFLKVTMKNLQCGNKIFYVPIKPDPLPQFNPQTPVPDAVCNGGYLNICPQLGLYENCALVDYSVKRYNTNGFIGGIAYTKSINECLNYPVAPTLNSCDEYLDVEVRVRTVCDPVGTRKTYRVYTPYGPPVSNFLSNTTVQTGICPCKGFYYFYVPGYGCASDYEWQLTTDAGSPLEYSNSGPQFTTMFSFGNEGCNFPQNQDILLKCRAKNKCGWGPWDVLRIPAGYFRAPNSPLCNSAPAPVQNQSNNSAVGISEDLKSINLNGNEIRSEIINENKDKKTGNESLKILVEYYTISGQLINATTLNLNNSDKLIALDLVKTTSVVVIKHNEKVIHKYFLPAVNH